MRDRGGRPTPPDERVRLHPGHAQGRPSRGGEAAQGHVRQPRQRPRAGAAGGARRQGQPDLRHRRVGRHQPRPRPPGADDRRARSWSARRDERTRAAGRGAARRPARCASPRTSAATIWAKLLVNSVFSGLGAVAGQTYAEVVANPAGKAVALRMWREGYEVGLAQGLHPGKVLGVEAAALAEGDDSGARHRDGGPRRHLRVDAPGPRARRAHRGRRDRRRGRREGPGMRHSDTAARARNRADPRRRARRTRPSPDALAELGNVCDHPTQRGPVLCEGVATNDGGGAVE